MVLLIVAVVFVAAGGVMTILFNIVIVIDRYVAVIITITIVVSIVVSIIAVFVVFLLFLLLIYFKNRHVILFNLRNAICVDKEMVCTN